MEDRELKVMASKVKVAAEKCPQAKEIFKELWPSEFKEQSKFKVGDIVKVATNPILASSSIVGKVGKIIKDDGSAILYGILCGDDHGWARTESLEFLYRDTD